ncbi:ribonuclease Y [Candidatus Parcubacteria bacterium]|nr:MAG: ribonuclease Y [Candidatus Parcubacteria bacterium]
MDFVLVFLGLGSLLIGALAGYFIRHIIAIIRANSVEQRIREKIQDAEERAKKIVLEGEEKAASLLAEVRKEEKKRQERLDEVEQRLTRKEEALEKKHNVLLQQEKALRSKEDELRTAEKALEEKKNDVEKKLEEISGLSREEARERIIAEIKERYSEDFAELARKILRSERDALERRVGEVITAALQRYARSHVAEITTTTFPLPSEELKGKIIGREGRNIRALERATGVELVIDETPDSILISSFDPYRREIARLALEKLIEDGRIQPVKIEEKVEEAKQELSRRILEIGENAAEEVNVYDLPKEILQLLGRLHFRTSYGQNVLAHSVEMAHLAGMIAKELGLDVEVAKRGALLHDIGKALDQDVEGTHVEIGRKLLKKYGVDERIIQAMQSHHDDYPYAIPEAYVVTTADILSAGRPGARRGTLESYIKRLADLERIAREFPGVENAYALSAGREIRVFVTPEKVDDFGALELARKIADRVQSELKYPGEIKVNVIRELRAVEYAR